jgi:hypothetical protein
VHDNYPTDAALMIGALNARAHIAGEIRLPDGTEIDIEGVARRAWGVTESEIRMNSDYAGPPVLTIAVEGEDDAEMNDLERDDHGYVAVPMSALPNVPDVPANEGWPAGGWNLDYDYDGAHVALTIRVHRTG